MSNPGGQKSCDSKGVLSFACRGPKFEQLASATLKLKDIDDTIGTFELKCEPENNTGNIK